MTLDIRGSLKNTKLSSNKYVVFEELISNSIDSFLIRRNQQSSQIDLKIAVEIELFSTDLLGGGLDVSISCSDNGCGMGDEQTNAFLTKDTSYKDDLSIAGIGPCKGSGRIQFFHHFEEVGLRSTFEQDGAAFARTLSPLPGRKKIDQQDFSLAPSDLYEVGTTVNLRALKPITRQRFYNEPLIETFSASNVRRHMLIAFLQRLVSLKAELGAFRISFQTTTPDGEVEMTTLEPSDLPPVSDVKAVEIEERNPRTGDALGKWQTLKLSHYKLDAKQYDLPRNGVSLCAKSSPVMDITSRYLRTRTEQNKPLDGYHHIILIEGDLLDRRVNEQRDGFDNIPAEIPADDLFADETVSYDAIYEKLIRLLRS